MVGFFQLGHKGSPAKTTKSTDTTRPATPPPPYAHSNASSVFSTAMTTTTTTTTRTVTTTQTTTHFFSLPLLRRRTQRTPTSTPSSSRQRAMAVDDLGVLKPSSSNVYTRDKDLPPTPPADEERHSTSSPSAGPSYQGALRPNNTTISLDNIVHSESMAPSLSSIESGQGAAALARAALGLGLPPLAVSSTGGQAGPSEVNSVSFFTAVPYSNGSVPTLVPDKPPVRRAKSFHRGHDGPSHAAPDDIRERRRNRGLSLGPFLSASEEKSKEKQDAPERKSLSRKGSFWNRRRNDSRPLTPVVPPAPSQFLQHPSLPNLQPVSPFYVDAKVQPSTLKPETPLSPGALRRRHSERTSSSYGPSSPVAPSPPDDLSTPHRRQRSGRPQTADISISPRVVSTYFSSPQSMHTTPGKLSESPGVTEKSSTLPPSRITSARPRAQTNPPLFHRLSLNLFGSSSPSSSPNASNMLPESYTRSPSTSFSSSRPSVRKYSPRPSVEIPRPRLQEEESPELYLRRLTDAVSKAEIASVLASSGDEFHSRALQAYLARFNFNHDPLDVALRRLLMDVGLPRETQQIDRFMEAFAAQYRRCHPNLFASDDHPYILAFSLIMLHTDAFNKSNKRKMTKADYMKNTRLPGVPPEVLDCFYDNIVFAPFIFIEDSLDVNGQRGLVAEGSITRRSSTINLSPGGMGTTGTLLGKNSKIDPYYLITRNLLDDLRVNIRTYVPLFSPYSYRGTAKAWDENSLLRAFATASVIEVASESKFMATPWFGLGVGGGPSSVAMLAAPTYSQAAADVVALKVTKVGSLLRKDEITDGGRKVNNRKWKEWSVLLTGSQLLFSRDPTWAALIQTRANPGNAVAVGMNAFVPRPDEIHSVKDAVAVYDQSYLKHPNTLRLAMPGGHHLLLQAQNENEMNDWIACVNYASTFKTAGVRMRSLGLSGRDLELTGQAAAVSHLRDMNKPALSPRIRTWDGRASADVLALANDSSQSSDRSLTDSPSEEPNTPMDNPSRLFKATFDQVKADLASGEWQTPDSASMRPSTRPRAYSLESTLQCSASPTRRPPEDGTAPLPSRSKVIRRKVHDLDSKLAVQKSQLDSDMRFVRNMAIMTPFQRATRERLQSAVQNVAKRIMQVRLDIEKLTCHREVLAKDLIAEEHDWQRTKRIALRAATEKLELERKQSLPRMTLSMYMDGAHFSTSSPTQAQFVQGRPNLDDTRPESAATGSYHSAYGHGPESSQSIEDPSRLSASFSFESATALVADSSAVSSPYSNSPKATPLSAHSSMESALAVTDEHSGTGHEKFYTAPETPEEEAEDWNKTRAAKRVSLVRLPSDLRINVLFNKHARGRDDASSNDGGPKNTGLPRSIGDHGLARTIAR